MNNFYSLQGKMESLLTGDLAIETLAIAEDEYENNLYPNLPCEKRSYTKARNVPLGEDIKWICGDCMATDWTTNNQRCKYCRE